MGSGRASGFYKQQERKANPEFAAECQAEADREERRRRRWEAKMRAEQEEREREREEQREDHRQDNGGSSADKENRSRRPQQAQPGQRWKREDFEEQRSKTWSEYDKAFTEFCARDFGTGCFNVSAIPLPPIGHAPVAPSSTQEEWHRNIKKAALRWHPDKWATFMRMLDDDPEQQARLKQLCEKMFRSLTLCRDRGFRMRASCTVGGA